MAGLSSDLFQNDPKLEAALTVDSAPILSGHAGEHVKKIQCALTLLLDDPPAAIDDGERQAGSYGPTTAESVLRYQTERSVNSEYQTASGGIVGRMTLRALDKEITRYEAEFGTKDCNGITARCLRHARRDKSTPAANAR
jgi:peptidoglycan hydrolase-like protein with peptidoglycan-binding domain